MAPANPSQSPSAPKPEPVEGGGLPRRRIPTPPGVPAQSSPSLETTRSLLRAAGRAGFNMEEAAALSRGLEGDVHGQAVTYRKLWRMAEEDAARQKREYQRIHADLMRLLDAFHPSTAENAYALLEQLYGKYYGEGGQ